ncbi:MAG: hypothetical protein QXN68_04265 [Thermoplasmata archaeon]
MLVFFSIFLIIISILSEFYFLRHGTSLRLMNIPNLLYIYILRPIAILSVGTSLLYSREFDINNYKLAWFLASLYILFENMGYYLTFPRLKGIRTAIPSNGLSDFENSKSIQTILRVNFWLILISILFLFLMFLTAGTSFLAQNRNMAMVAVNPLLRYFYPFVQLSAALLGFLSVVLITLYKKFFTGIFFFIISLFLTSLIYQRGMTIAFVMLSSMISLDIYRIKGELNLKKAFKFLLVLVVLFFILIFLRDIYNFVVTGQIDLFKSLQKNITNNSNQLLVLLIIRPDGDILEVWTILLRYLSKNPPLLGNSLIKIPFMLTSSNFRLSTGMKTGVDILNEYYDFNTYWYKKYGFNLNVAQEMVLNFSFVGVFFGFVTGLFNGLLTKWYYKKVLNGDFFRSTIYFNSFSYFLGTFASFQWMVFQLAFSEIITLLAKVRINLLVKDNAEVKGFFYEI